MRVANKRELQSFSAPDVIMVCAQNTNHLMRFRSALFTLSACEHHTSLGPVYSEIDISDSGLSLEWIF